MQQRKRIKRNIGRVVVERLLDAKHNVVVISRHPEKLAAAIAKGAIVLRGSIDEDAVVERALEGADALFWLTPISFEPVDYMAWAKDIAQRAASAARRRGVRRAVVISSIGAQHDSGVGPIELQPRHREGLLDRGAERGSLLAGLFMENLLQHVGVDDDSLRGFGRHRGRDAPLRFSDRGTRHRALRRRQRHRVRGARDHAARAIRPGSLSGADGALGLPDFGRDGGLAVPRRARLPEGRSDVDSWAARGDRCCQCSAGDDPDGDDQAASLDPRCETFSSYWASEGIAMAYRQQRSSGAGG